MQTIRLSYYVEDDTFQYKWWLKDGRHHRLGGPAIEWSNGYKEWWVEDEYLSSERVQ